jgi:DNA replication protein DnaC
MNEHTLEKMKQMKFYGMYHAFKSALETNRLDGYTTDEFVSFLVGTEHDDRQTRKINRYISNAKFRYKASLEDLIYDDTRSLDKNNVMRLAECSFIKQGENLIVTGSTGVGKSYLASALGHHACSKGYRVMYFNAAKLFAKLKIAKADGSYVKEIARIERQDVLLLDDFCLQPMDNQARLVLLDLVEDRHAKRSMIITSQYPTDTWHERIGDNTVADAILDRIVHNAHRVELTGESMRRKKSEKQPMQIIN